MTKEDSPTLRQTGAAFARNWVALTLVTSVLLAFSLFGPGGSAKTVLAGIMAGTVWGGLLSVSGGLETPFCTFSPGSLA